MLEDKTKIQLEARDLLHEKLGNNIRIHRLRRRLSLKELSLLTQIDRKHLYLMERGRANITIDKIWKISKVLKTDLSELIEGKFERFSKHIKASEIKYLTDNQNSFIGKMLCSKQFDLGFEMEEIQLFEEYSEKYMAMRIGTFKLIFVTQGSLAIGFDSKLVHLDKGDIFLFESDTAYKVFNLRKELSTFIMISTYHRFDWEESA